MICHRLQAISVHDVLQVLQQQTVQGRSPSQSIVNHTAAKRQNMVAAICNFCKLESSLLHLTHVQYPMQYTYLLLILPHQYVATLSGLAIGKIEPSTASTVALCISVVTSAACHNHGHNVLPFGSATRTVRTMVGKLVMLTSPGGAR